MTNLVIDIGNSFTKTAFFDNTELLESEVHDTFTISTAKQLLDKHAVDGAIMSSVKSFDSDATSVLQDKCFFIELNHQTPVPVKNLYQSPETLGMDRLAGVTGASAFFPGKNVLVVDAGTCITFDIVTDKKEYLGGSISPGLNMRFKALNNFTGKLPFLDITNIDYLWGKTTEESVLAGVINGTLAETDEIINSYHRLFPELIVVFCGGDMFFFDKKLKNKIFAFEKIVLYGLNEILKHNVQLHKNKKKAI